MAIWSVAVAMQSPEGHVQVVAVTASCAGPGDEVTIGGVGTAAAFERFPGHKLLAICANRITKDVILAAAQELGMSAAEGRA